MIKQFLLYVIIILAIYVTILTILTIAANLFELNKMEKSQFMKDCHPILVTTNGGYFFEYPCTVEIEKH